MANEGDRDINTLHKDTKTALLKLIESKASSNQTPLGILQLGHAYALVVGAKWGHLPGSAPASSE